jgi:hypothetical protein
VRRIYCTFSGSMYDETTQRIVEDAPKFGVDEVRVYDDRWLMETEFYRLNRWIFDLKSKGEHRGFGWYAWKPFVILQEMERWESTKFAPATILWTDADTYPVGDLTPLYQRCHDDGGIMLFAAEGWTQGQSTKRDCMIAMDADHPIEPCYRFKQHATARFALFEAGNYRAKQFLMEWLTYCLNPLCVGLEPSVLAPEYQEYQEHRSDQSTLTNLAHKYGLRLYREADQFGDGTDRDRDLYGTVFHQIGCYDKPRNLNGSKWRNV